MEITNDNVSCALVDEASFLVCCVGWLSSFVPAGRDFRGSVGLFMYPEAVVGLAAGWEIGPVGGRFGWMRGRRRTAVPDGTPPEVVVGCSSVLQGVEVALALALTKFR